MKKISKGQAAALLKEILKRYPDLHLEIHDRAAKVEVKISKRARDIEEARGRGWHEGYNEGLAFAERKKKEDEASLKRQRETLHLEVLRQMREQYSAFGQMMQVLGRAMESEKNQL